MRIHTTIDPGTMRGIIGPGKAFGGRPLPVVWRKLDMFRSRSAPFGYDVTLEGSGGRNNTGLYGAGDYNGATWDEWGAFFGRVYNLDPAARCGGTTARPIYSCADDYHWQTGHRFEAGQVPDDSHPRHNWEHAGYSPGHYYTVRECKRCAAIQRWLVHMAWDEFTYSTGVTEYHTGRAS